MTKNVQISDIRRMGKLNQHLKFNVGELEAVYFNAPPLQNFGEGSGVRWNLVYSIDQNTWNGSTKLQLIIKELVLPP